MRKTQKSDFYPQRIVIKLPYNDALDYLDELLQLMPKPKRYIKPKYERIELLKAVIYRLQTGCKWHKLPKHFPAWQSASVQYQKWRNLGYIKTVQDFLNARVK